VTNPGRGACLQASAPVVDVGLSLPWTWRLGRPVGHLNEWMGGMLSIGPKLAYSLRVAGGSAWSTLPDSDHPLSLPGFQGPVGPIGGGYAGIEVQFGVGLMRPRGVSR
jgi:hypothetical protein